MRINNLSEGFESYFLHSVISNTFGVEGFVGTKSCGEVKLQNLRETFAKFAKLFVKNNFFVTNLATRLQDFIFNGKKL